MRLRPRSPRPMLRFLLWLCLCAALLGGRPAAAQRAIFLVRHAEKVDESRDPELSPAGQARAARLAAHLERAGISAVYVTEYKRTQKTAAPLASALKLTPQAVPAQDRKALVAKLRERPDAVALVVGHSDTLPLLLRELGVAAPPLVTDYGDLFVVVPAASGPPTLLRLRF